MAAANEYVRTDEYGVMRVADTHVMLESVAIAFQQGDSPEAIQRQYPSLALEQVYGAITWCLAHPREVEDYLRKQEGVWDLWKARFGQAPNPAIERLRTIKASFTSPVISLIGTSLT